MTLTLFRKLSGDKSNNVHKAKLALNDLEANIHRNSSSVSKVIGITDRLTVSVTLEKLVQTF